ncbi:MAG: MFS transporter [Actinomycetota bacterium]
MSAGQPSGPTRLATASWILYDLANTIFALGVVGLYFSDWLAAEGHPDSFLAGVQVAAATVVIFLAPWAGARSDVLGKRVPTLVATTVLAVIATSLLAIGPVWFVLAMLWIAVVSVNTGAVVYDALLVDVSTEENRGKISGWGIGVGYVGSSIGLGLGILALDVFGWGYPGAFRLIAGAFLVFALPAFFFIDERGGRSDADLPDVRDIVRRLIQSWGTARRYDGVVHFLIGRFFYTDAINTLVGGFLALFVLQELGLDRGFVTTLLGIAIAGAMLGGIGAGPFIERLGPLRVLRWVLVMWILAIAAGIVASVSGITAIAWVIGPLGGIALGATWASDRVVMIRVSPPRYLGEFYGLYATVGRFASIVGPLVWALIVDLAGLSRNIAMGALALFIAIGWTILGKVNDQHRTWPTKDLLVPNVDKGRPTAGGG